MKCNEIRNYFRGRMIGFIHVSDGFPFAVICLLFVDKLVDYIKFTLNI